MVKLFVSGFPLEITEIELAKLIAPHGDISTIKIVRDKQTRKCKGYAFIEMLTEDGAAQAAAALDGTTMVDRELTVKLSEERPVKPPPKRNFNAPRNTSYPNRSYNNNNNNQSSETERPKRPRKSF
ncbi:RNA recognition motif domain-containing protein [Mucilaginibacter terrae]|uniref:RNA recognition motif-containing protein n=1 Tax=Mucilaginibacter terrae TaxID=1955052 RepID=A0ABU3GY59_9SPHI|nr:RNA-binding protein [Mucilaginibacter terrae]MDT3404698.1 RNA recognition motif-containing protein [Mucilaginibacter terrae]